MIGEIFTIGAVLSFVLSNVIFKKIDLKVSPSQINTIRTIIGFLTYFIIALAVGKFTLIFSFPPMLWFWLALSFFFGQVLGDTSYFKAQEMLGTTVALSISMTSPIFTTIISFFLGTDIPVYFYGSMSLIVVGVIIIALGKNDLILEKLKLKWNKKEINIEEDEISATDNEVKVQNGEENSTEKEPKIKIIDQKEEAVLAKKSNRYIVFAIFIALFAAISWSIGAILTEKAINDVSQIAGTEGFSSLLGNIVRFPIAAIFLSFMTIGDRKTKVKTWSLKTWLWLILGALIGTSLGAYLYTESLYRVNAVFVSIIASASPLFSMPISWIINKEKVNLLEVLGILLTISGVILILVLRLVN